MWRFAFILALVATACRAEINFIVDVTEDGSGTVGAELGLDEEFRDLIQNFGGNPQDFLSDFNIDIPGAITRQRTEGDLTYSVTEATFADPAALKGLVRRFSTGQEIFEALDIQVDEGGASIDARIVVPSIVDEFGGATDFGFDPSQFTEEIFSFNFIAALPGTIQDENADERLADGRLRWVIPITGGEVDIHAESSIGGGGFPLWLVVLVAIAIVGGGGLWLTSRRRQQQAVNRIRRAETAAGTPRRRPRSAERKMAALEASRDADGNADNPSPDGGDSDDDD